MKYTKFQDNTENEQNMYFRVVVLAIIPAFIFKKILNFCILKFSKMSIVYMYIHTCLYMWVGVCV